MHSTYIYIELRVTVCSAEAAGQTDVELTLDTSVSTNTESLPVKEQLSPMVSELGEPSHQSDEASRYTNTVICFCVLSVKRCFFVCDK